MLPMRRRTFTSRIRLWVVWLFVISRLIKDIPPENRAPYITCAIGMWIMIAAAGVFSVLNPTIPLVAPLTLFLIYSLLGIGVVFQRENDEL